LQSGKYLEPQTGGLYEGYQTGWEHAKSNRICVFGI